jgi:hypothetical protein
LRVDTQFQGEAVCAFVVIEGGDIGVAEAVFVEQAAVVLLAPAVAGIACAWRGGGRGGGGIIFGGRGEGEGEGEGGAEAVGEGEVFVGFGGEGEGGDGVEAVFGGPEEEVAFSGGEGAEALRVGGLGGERVELGIVEDLELHGSAADGDAGGVKDPDGGLCGGGVMVGDINFGVDGCLLHDFFLPPVTAEDLSVHEHGTCGGSVEPSEVEHRLGFAGTEEDPLSVEPGFDPGMVVIGMCPSRGVDLACGDTDGA